MKELIGTFIGILILSLVGAATFFWFTYSHNAFLKERNACAADADKLFAVEIVKWREANKTDAFNPFRKERDQRVEDCLKRDGKWCVWDWTTGPAIWPSTWADAFAPRNDRARRVYQTLYLNPSDGRFVKFVD